MQKNMKKLVSTLGAIAFVATAFGITAMNAETAKAEEKVSLAITGKTLTVSSNVNVSFFVPVAAVGDKEDITVKVAENSVDGDYVTLTATTENYEYNGAEYYEFIYKGVMAYEMANNLYAYAEMGTEKSETVKYSVLQYAYTKLGMAKAEKKDTTEGLDTLLNAMLSYGSAAAKFNGIEVDYLSDYTYVSIANATFDDGFSYGLFKKGTTVNVTANAGYKLDDVNGVFTQEEDSISFVVPEEKYIDNTSFIVDEGITADQKIEEEIAKITIGAPATIEQNKTFTLPETNVEYEDVTIEWNVENATLNNGVVTFNQVGKATITVSVSCDGGETQTKSAEVDVKAPALPESLAIFEFGANGNASHVDGNSLGTSKSYTEGGYTLSLTNMANVYGPAYDAKGNSCIKLGASSKAGSFTFSVPENVTKVVFKVAKYKTNTSKITINGTTSTLTKNSENGEYDLIEINTTTNKTISVTTVSGGYRVMMNSIEFIGFAK